MNETSERIPVDDLPEDVKSEHYGLYTELADHIFPSDPSGGSDTWPQLLTLLLVYRKPIQTKEIDNFMKVCSELEKDNRIYPGDYQVLEDIFTKLKLVEPLRIVNARKRKIVELLNDGASETKKRLKVNQKLQNLLDQTELQLEEWKERRHIFIETRAFLKCKERLKKNGFVNIIGIHGDGKSSIAKELVLQSGRTPIIVEGPGQWGDIVQSSLEVIALVDDIFGKFPLDNDRKAQWLLKLSSMYSDADEKKIQIITTCDEHVFMSCDTYLSGFELFGRANNVHLSGSRSDFSLQRDERLQMMGKHISVANPSVCIYSEAGRPCPSACELRVSEESLERIADVDMCLGFPLCFKEFLTDPKYLASGELFFKHPIHMIEKMDPLNYCTLGCVLILKGLTKECLEKIDRPNKVSDRVTCIAKVCGIDSVSSRDIQNAAIRMSTTYLTYRNGYYRFSHDSIKEAVFLFFCSRTELVLEHCDFALIGSLSVQKGQYGQLCRRLVREITENRKIQGRLRDVVSHTMLNDDNFVQVLMSHLNSLPQKVDVIQSTDRDGFSILYFSALYSYWCFVEKLLEVAKVKLATDESLCRTELQKCRDVQLQRDIDSALYNACRGGNVSVYMGLIHSGCTPDSRCLQAFNETHSKNPEILEDLIRHTNWSSGELSDLLLLTCDTNNYRAYEYLTRERGFRPDVRCLQHAVLKGMPEIVSDLVKYDHWPEDKHILLLEGACGIGDHNLYIVLKEKFGLTPDQLCLLRAAKSGAHLIIDDMEQYRHWASSDIEEALDSACGACNFECYQSLIKFNMKDMNTVIFLSSAVSSARENNDYRIVDDLRMRGYELPELSESDFEMKTLSDNMHMMEPSF